MTGHFDARRTGSLQNGAALVTVLTLIAAIAALSSAVMRDVALETTMTRHFGAQVRARQAAFSAIETVLANSPLPLTGEISHELSLGPGRQFNAVVTIRFLGESIVEAQDAGGLAGAVRRHFELTAEVTDQRGTQHRRRLYRSVTADTDPLQ